MANKKNKVKFNIRNVHYALLTKSDDGEVTYGTPVPMPGAVSISLDPNGEPSVFYADGYAYYTINNNQGYEGDLELALVPESFRTDVLKCLLKMRPWKQVNLHCCLNLMVTSIKSVMCFIIARQQDLPLNQQQRKMRLRSRQKPCRLRHHLLMGAM